MKRSELRTGDRVTVEDGTVLIVMREAGKHSEDILITQKGFTTLTNWTEDLDSRTQDPDDKAVGYWNQDIVLVQRTECFGIGYTELIGGQHYKTIYDRSKETVTLILGFVTVDGENVAKIREIQDVRRVPRVNAIKMGEELTMTGKYDSYIIPELYNSNPITFEL